MPKPAIVYRDSFITLYHGDCKSVVASLDDESIDMVLTDPPYGHNNNDGDLIHQLEKAIPARRSKQSRLAGTEEDARPIANDGPEANELVQWMFAESRRVLKPGHGCCCCCCGGGGPDPQFARWSLWMDKHLNFKQMVIWDKGPMGLGWHYRRSYEVVLVGEKPGAKCHWFGDNCVENIIRPGSLGLNKIIPSKNHHPTEKPINLMIHFIKLHSQKGEVILDPFAGRGTTLLAAKLMGRRAIGCELDKEFIDMAIERLDTKRLPACMDINIAQAAKERARIFQ